MTHSAIGIEVCKIVFYRCNKSAKVKEEVIASHYMAIKTLMRIRVPTEYNFLVQSTAMRGNIINV
jgi:hypothetical protein